VLSIHEYIIKNNENNFFTGPLSADIDEMPISKLTAAEKKERIERMLETNRGPLLTQEELEAKKIKKMDTVGKQLLCTLRLPSVPGAATAAPIGPAKLEPRHNFKSEECKQSVKQRTPSQVGHDAIAKHVQKNYFDKGATPNWTEVSRFFGLNDGRSAQRLFDQSQQKQDPLPTFSNAILNIERKLAFLQKAEEFRASQLQQDAKDWIKVIDSMRLEQIQESKPNTVLEDLSKLDMRTYKKLIDWALPEKQSTTKILTNGRIQGQQEPRNAISCAAAVLAEFPDTAPEVIWSHDVFTIYLDPTNNAVKVVRMPKGTLAELAAMRLTPGVQSHAGSAQLGKIALPAFAGFDASGELLEIIILNVDSNVPQPEKGHPYSIYPLECNGSNPNPVHNSTVFAAVLPYQFNEDAFMQQVWSTIVIPKSDERCYQLMRMELEGALQPIAVPEATPSPLPSRTQDVVSQNLVPWIEGCVFFESFLLQLADPAPLFRIL
jgi:hypothetical protein